MPLPWKKSRVSRISRLVADLQSQPNIGNPLVVETGFPTSLIDLFVKNRERLKKPSNKKKKKHQQQQQQQQLQCSWEGQQVKEEELVISNPIPLSSSRDFEVPRRHAYVEVKKEEDKVLQRQDNFLRVKSKLVSENRKNSNLFNQTVVQECDSVVEGNDDGMKKVNGRCVLMGVLKMFVVVVLALSTRKLAVGITMSAFVLIFLEYVGKHVLCFLKPCLHARRALGSIFRGVFSLVRAIWGLLIAKQVEDCEEPRKGLMREENGASESDSCDLVDFPEEIQAMETNLDTEAAHVEEIKSVEMKFDLLRCAGKRWRGLDTETMVRNLERNLEAEENKTGVLMCEKEAKQRGLVRKTILKKLVPKKLRNGKKWKKNKETMDRDSDCSSEVSSCRGEDKLGPNQAIDNHEHGDQINSQERGKILLAQLLEIEDADEDEEEEEVKLRKGKEEFDHAISASGTGLQAKEELFVVKDKQDLERKGNSGYSILFFAALVGLVGGRTLALVLTVVSCLILKLFGRRKTMCK